MDQQYICDWREREGTTKYSAKVYFQIKQGASLIGIKRYEHFNKNLIK